MEYGVKNRKSKSACTETLSLSYYSAGLPCWRVARVKRQKDISKDWILIHSGSVDRATERKTERDRQRDGLFRRRADKDWSSERHCQQTEEWRRQKKVFLPVVPKRDQIIGTICHTVCVGCLPGISNVLWSTVPWLFSWVWLEVFLDLHF